MILEVAIVNSISGTKPVFERASRRARSIVASTTGRQAWKPLLQTFHDPFVTVDHQVAVEGAPDRGAAQS
jgi:hypothetical protein